MSRHPDAIRDDLAREARQRRVDAILGPDHAERVRARRRRLVREAVDARIPKREVARLLGISRPTVYADLAAGTSTEVDA